MLMMHGYAASSIHCMAFLFANAVDFNILFSLNEEYFLKNWDLGFVVVQRAVFDGP